MDGRLSGSVGGWKDEQRCGQMERHVDMWMSGRMSGGVDGWKGEWT